MAGRAPRNDSMKDKLQKLKVEILAELEKVNQLEVLRALKIKYLGRKGELTKILRAIAELSAVEKKSVGRLANQIKKEAEEKFKRAEAGLEKSSAAAGTDPTLPGKKIPAGHLHPITILEAEIEELFASMGFMALDGPELESDYYNFTALNIPPYHPARDTQDTFYVDHKNKDGEYDLLMRTQTSPMQVRAMKKFGAPLRAVAPGRCFRSEATDVRHEHTFYQLEGLMIDRGINFSHLKAVLEEAGRRLFGPETKLRLRPKYYSFVEPGANGEYSCFLCSGRGCRLCKGTGWLEIVGSGMVHPDVLAAAGVDPKIYQGFAFGYGLDRLAMLKYGINDIRLFHGGDLRFLKQF